VEKSKQQGAVDERHTLTDTLDGLATKSEAVAPPRSRPTRGHSSTGHARRWTGPIARRAACSPGSAPSSRCSR